MSNCRGVCVFSYICFFVAFAGVKEHLKGHRRRHWSVLRACHRTAATPTGHQTHTRNHTDSHADNQVAKTKHTHRDTGRYLQQRANTCHKQVTHSDRQTRLATHSHLQALLLQPLHTCAPLHMHEHTHTYNVVPLVAICVCLKPWTKSQTATEI